MIYAFLALLGTVPLALALTLTQAQAQDNVLGLPAVPQAALAPPPSLAKPAASSPQAGTSSARKASPGASAANAALASDAQAKGVLSGGVTLASRYQGLVATVRVITNTVYASKEQRQAAAYAARLVQRDLRLVCGAQCKPTVMPAPLLLPDGKLQFEMSIAPYPRVLSQSDMVAMLLGKPLAVIAPAAAKASSAAAQNAP